MQKSPFSHFTFLWKILILLALLLSFNSLAEARQKYQGYAIQGTSTISLFGTSYKVPKIYPGATITIYRGATGTTLASLYSDDAGTTKSNPTVADSSGFFSFYIDNGHYSIRVSGSGVSSPFTLSDFIANDPSLLYFDVANYGVLGNGTTDDKAALQSAIDAAPDYSTIVIPTSYNLSISNTIKINNRIGLRLVGGIGSTSEYAGGGSSGSRITWNGAANGIMLQMIDSNSCSIEGIAFKMVGSNLANCAAYGIFTTADYDITLTGVTATASSTTITYTSALLNNQLPNGDLLHKGRNITIPGAGPAAASLTTPISNITTSATGASTTLTLTTAASSNVAAGTATIPNPYGSHSSSSHTFKHLVFTWSTATTNVPYRTAIANDLYSSQNHERVRTEDVTVYGNATTLGANSGICLSNAGITNGLSVISFTTATNCDTGATITVSAAMIGRSAYIPTAGAGGLYLIGVVTAATASTITISTTASATVSGQAAGMLGLLYSTGNYGIGISFGGYYDSGSTIAPSPLSGYGGGSNVLECHTSDVFTYGVSYGIHGGYGNEFDRIEGSYSNVAMFGSFSGAVRDLRYEGTRQHFHGFGNLVFIAPHIAAFFSGHPVYEINGGTTTFTMINMTSDSGTGAFGGVKVVSVLSPTVAYGTIISSGSIDTALNVRDGTDYTGFQNLMINAPDDVFIFKGMPINLPSFTAFGAGLPTRPVGTIMYCSDCTIGSSPCSGGGTGTFAVRVGGPIWRCL